MSQSPSPLRSGFWYESASFLPGAFVLCFASLASGGLGALFAFRLLYGPGAPSLWQMLRLVFSHAVGR
jgi:hypothetical protein